MMMVNVIRNNLIIFQILRIGHLIAHNDIFQPHDFAGYQKVADDSKSCG
jgi:hypothetical protein